MASRQLSGHAKHVLQALKTQKCVLIKGVPAAGKSRLLAEVESAFVQRPGAQVGGNPTILVPPDGSGLSALLPSPRRSDRRRWPLVMNQNTRYRDFLRAPQAKLDGGQGFELSKGALYRANEHAKTPNGAALITIDELNRGPAVQVFGPSIVAIEADKRADEDNAPIDGQTASFELQTEAGDYEDYWLSPHLYLVCAQNNADTSVEPIDTAFLRRFEPVDLFPDEGILLEHFGLSAVDGDLPDTADNPEAVYRAAVRAWRNVNRKLRIGADADHQLGHGALMNPNSDVPTATTEEALRYVERGWARVDQHVGEVFYGKPEHVADAFWVNEGGLGHPYKLETTTFGDLDQLYLERDDSDLYRLLRAIATAT